VAGEPAKHVDALEALADKFGEDSDIFTGHVSYTACRTDPIIHLSRNGLEGKDTAPASAWDEIEARPQAIEATPAMPMAAAQHTSGDDVALAQRYHEERQNGHR